MVTERPIHVPDFDYREFSSQSRAIATLKEYHAMFDLMVGDGGIDNFADTDAAAWDDFLTSEVFNAKKYRNIGIELAEIQGLQIDMETLGELAEIAKNTHDDDALRYMHRILHDLDIHAFPGEETKAGDFWGVTNTVPAKDSSRREEMGAFITNN